MNTSRDLSQTAEYRALAQSVPAEWRDEFFTFVTSGVASEAFLTFLDSDERTQQAVETVVSEEIRNFNRFAESLNIDPEVIDGYLKRKKRKPLEIARAAAAKIVAGLMESVSLKVRERQDLRRSVTAAIPADQASDVKRLLAELRDDLDASTASGVELDEAQLQMKPSR